MSNIVEFISVFGDDGFLGSVGEGDDGRTFTKMVAIIEGARANFVPY